MSWECQNQLIQVSGYLMHRSLADCEKEATMQIRCVHCGIPFTLSKETIHAALDTLNAQNQKHFDARCPQCRKVNPISLERLQRAAPDWSAEAESAESN
jgi:phage FluMu protein Com